MFRGVATERGRGAPVRASGICSAVIAAAIGSAGRGGIEGGFNGVGEFGIVGFGVCAKAAEDPAIFTDENLFKVPLDIAGEILVLGAGELSKEGVFVVASDGDFGEEGEIDIVFRVAEDFDFFVGAGFLSAEVIGGKCEDCEVFVAVYILEGDEGVVLGRGTALGCGIDDEEDFSPMGAQIGGRAVDVSERLIVDGLDGFWLIGGNGIHEKERGNCDKCLK